MPWTVYLHKNTSENLNSIHDFLFGVSEIMNQIIKPSNYLLLPPKLFLTKLLYVLKVFVK